MWSLAQLRCYGAKWDILMRKALFMWFLSPLGAMGQVGSTREVLGGRP